MISCDFALIFASPSDSTRAGSMAERCKRAVFSVSIRCLLDARNQTTALSETPHACPSPSSARFETTFRSDPCDWVQASQRP
eukprot:6205512-Pleurochrysis_carterae.AAC.1